MADEKTVPPVPADILANFDNTVEQKPAIFRFKKDKLGVKRANVELSLLTPSVEGVVAILQKGQTPEGKKGLDLLMEAVYDVVRGVAADIIGEDEKINAANFPYAKLAWDTIANMPKEDRRSSSIPSEVWEAFAKDYIDVMPALTGKTVEQCGNATTIFLKKFAQIKANKPILKALKEQLGLYVNTSKNAENFQEIIDLLNEKVDTYINSNEIEQLVTNL